MAGTPKPDSNDGFQRHPSGVLLGLAAIGVAISIWSLWDLSNHAARMAAIQDAAALAESVQAFRHLSASEIFEEEDAASQWIDTSAPRPGDARFRRRSAAFLEQLHKGNIGASIVIHESHVANPASGESGSQESSFQTEAWNRIQSSRETSYYRFETVSGVPTLRYAVEDISKAKSLAEDSVQSDVSELIEVSIPLNSDLVVDIDTDINQGLLLFSFLGLLWFSVAAQSLIASRKKSLRDQEIARGLTEINQRLERSIIERESAEEENRILEARVHASEKAEGLNLISGGVAQDFNNLLVPFLANADFLKSEIAGNSSAQECLEDIEIAANRAVELCRQMMAYAGNSSMECSRVDLNEAVSGISQHLTSNVTKNFSVTVDLEEGELITESDPIQMKQVLLNLVANASEAIGDQNGSIVIRTGSTKPSIETCELSELQTWDESDPGLPEALAPKPESYVFIEVIDNGCGISQENLTKVFDPFFTTKFVGRGLGLAAAHGIITAHAGTISIESELNLYTRVRVTLPRCEIEEVNTADQPKDNYTLQNSGRILLADDEPAVRAVAQRILEESGFEVVPASNGAEATKIFEAHSDRFDACVLDLTMPEKGGDDALAEIRKLNPAIPAVLISGYSEKIDDIKREQTEHTTFLQKPFRAISLQREVKRALNVSTQSAG